MIVKIKMPQLGQTSDEVKLIRWLVEVGQEIRQGQHICEVETDKVTMELESSKVGKVLKLMFEPDSEIRTGEVIVIIDSKSTASSKKASAKKPEPAEEKITKEVKSLSSGQKKKILVETGFKKAIEMYRSMLKIREFEEAIKILFLEGKMPGTIHQYTGMEACAVGVCSALEKNDVIASTHRPHGHAIARGLSLNEIMAELYGKTTGCCRGKGGSMHVGDLEKGMLPAIAIVGGNLPIVGGMALAFKMRGEPRIAVSFFGDGASNEGAFHEALNMAAIYNIPAIFVCENNLYGASTSIKQTLKLENIAQRVCAYGMRGDIADGMDVLDVYSKAKIAADFARQGNGPTLFELKTFRLCGHSRRDPCNYMTKEEKLYWQAKDPILAFEKLLLSEGILDEKSLKDIKDQVKKEITGAVEFGQTSPEPDPLDTYSNLYVNMEVPQ